MITPYAASLFSLCLRCIWIDLGWTKLICEIELVILVGEVDSGTDQFDCFFGYMMLWNWENIEKINFGFTALVKHAECGLSGNDLQWRLLFQDERYFGIVYHCTWQLYLVEARLCGLYSVYIWVQFYMRIGMVNKQAEDSITDWIIEAMDFIL